MTQPRVDRIFPSEAKRMEGPGSDTVYRMEFPDGEGRMTAHEVFSGVSLIFNDFQTTGGFPNEARCPGLIEINYCHAGRFDCTMADGRDIWLGPGDFAVSDMGRPPLESRFSKGIYQGISLVVEPTAAEQSLAAMLGEGGPSLTELFSSLLCARSFLLLRAESKIQHIFSELYQVPSHSALAYYRLKTAELMLFLHDRQSTLRRAGLSYYEHSRRQRTQEMGERLTEDLRRRVSIEELAKEYELGVSTVKQRFRQLYGEPPYTYLRRRRMEEAAFLLTTTDQPITQIAEAVGYQNASKFSAAFRSIYGLTPREYKKWTDLE